MRSIQTPSLLLMLACTALPAAGESALPAEVIPTHTFASFIKNWNDAKKPVFCAVLRTPAQWREVFAPAATMNQTVPFEPTAEFFETRQILAVSRVVPSPATADKAAWEFQSLLPRRKGVTFQYRFTPASSPGTYTVKDVLMVSTPQRAGAVDFEENGKRVCRAI